MRTAFALSSMLSLAFAMGCNPATEIDESVDCRDVCDRYRSCFNASYDTAACRNRCEGLVDADGGRPRAANDCDTCMDDRSCVSAVFTCQVPCAGTRIPAGKAVVGTVIERVEVAISVPSRFINASDVEVDRKFMAVTARFS